MTDKSNWPQWLRDADTKNARVEITSTGRVIWHDGVWRRGDWRDGIWNDGIWHDGIWRGGIWRDGFWYGGEWHDGDWRDGEWRGGIWRGGIWHDGVWRRGDWRGGEWHDGVWCGGIWRGGIWLDGDWNGGNDNPTRCMFRVRGSGDTIKVGCKEYTIEEARALCDEGDLPDEAPARDSEAGKLLRAAVLAQIAWQEALK